MSLNGFLFIDKPSGITSHDVVDEIRKKFGIRKVGHSGTLDPFASGLLIIGVGKATRLLEYIKGMDKTYEVEMKLGVITDTFDFTGELVEERESSHITEEMIRDAIESFTGEYMQVPPAYSAKKYKGERLHRLARQGKIINLPPKKVTIHDIYVKSFDPVEMKVSFVVKVSYGTYVRSLVTDIGYKLGCGATTTFLRRMAIGKFSVSDAVKLDEVDVKDIKPMNEVLSFMPAIVVSHEQAEKVLNGGQIYSDGVVEIKGIFPKEATIRIVNEGGNLLAIARSERTSKFIRTLLKKESRERVATLEKVFRE